VTFTSGAEGEIWTGSSLARPHHQPVHLGRLGGGATSFSNSGPLFKSPGFGQFRFFNGGGVSGGDNTTFEFDTATSIRAIADDILGVHPGGTSTFGIGGQGGVVSTWPSERRTE